MKKPWQNIQNDGWKEVAYDFGLDEEGNRRVAAILNQACHVFHQEFGGRWRPGHKNRYAAALATELDKYPELAQRLLETGDRVVRMLTFRASELGRRSGTA